MSKHTSKKKSKKGIIILFVIIVILAIIGGVSIFRYNKNKERLNELANLYFMGIDENKQIGKTQTDIEYNNNLSHAIEYPKTGNNEIDNQIKEIVEQLKTDFINQYKNEPIEEIIENTVKGVSYYQYIEYQTYLAPDNTMSLIFLESQERRRNSSNIRKSLYI